MTLAECPRGKGCLIFDGGVRERGAGKGPLVVEEGCDKKQIGDARVRKETNR